MTEKWLKNELEMHDKNQFQYQCGIGAMARPSSNPESACFMLLLFLALVVFQLTWSVLNQDKLKKNKC